MVLYLPTFLGSVINYWLFSRRTSETEALPKCKKYLIFSTAALVAGAAGCYVNSNYLAKIYSFEDYTAVQFSRFDIGRLINALNGFVVGYGYQTGGELLSIDCLWNVLAAVIMILIALSCIRCLRERQPEWCFYVCVYCSAIVVFLMLYAFSTMSYGDHYCIPIYVLGFPLLVKYASELVREGKRAIRGGVAAGAVLLLWFSYTEYQEILVECNNDEKVNVVQAVLEQGVYYGYASFWNGNVLTEISDGAIEMHAWSTDISGLTDFNAINRWLELKSHAWEIPEGKVFCLFESTEWESPLALQMQEENLVYSSDTYRLYVYDSYAEMTGTEN